MNAKYRVYVGTYTEEIRFGTGEIFQGRGEGIHLFRLHEDGTLDPITVTQGVKNPSYIWMHPTGRFLYAVNELKEFNGEFGGSVSAFSVTPESGEPTFLNVQPTNGTDPCHVVTDNDGRHVMVANFASGSVGIYPIGQDGTLGNASDFVQHNGSSIHPLRQTGPHAHSSVFDPANRFVFVPDLGLDRVIVYRYDTASGHLTEHSAVEMKPGAGPRHIVFDRVGRFAYIVTELDSTLTVCRYEASTGTLSIIETVSTLPTDFHGDSTCAEIALHPSGNFVYVSNRGHDSIAIFRVNRETGRVTPTGYEPTQGAVPRHFAVTPDGALMLVANKSSDTIVSFRIDGTTGTLTPTGNVTKVGTPVCVRIVPTM